MSTANVDMTSWADVHAEIEREVGVILFTVLRFTHGGTRMERVYSSHPAEYPVGDTKEVATEVSPDWIALSRDAGTPYFGAPRTISNASSPIPAWSARSAAAPS